MDEQSVTLSHDEGIPVITFVILHPTYCIVKLSLKAPDTNNWVQVLETDNRAQSAFEISFDDPASFPDGNPVGNDVQDFDGWRLGWVVFFDGHSTTAVDPYAITIGMRQGQNAVMHPEFKKQGDFDGPAKVFNGYVKFKVV